MGWTSQQQDAIDSIGRSVIVSAAAGSGKTAVLVERLTKQIINEENPVNADKIIIVTFTNDAAAELRQRINLRLQSMMNENPENRFLLKQYTLFQNAKISTIHSFCFDVIRNNTEHLDITSGFSILDDTENTLIENESAEEAMSLWSEKYPKKYSLLYDKFCMKTDENIKKVILEINRFLSSMPQREVWLKNTLGEFEKDYKNTVYYKDFVKSSKCELKKALELAEENLEMTDFMFDDVNEKTEELREKLVFQNTAETSLIVKCIDALETGNIPEISFKSLPSKRGITVSDKFKQNRDKYKAILKEYADSAEYIKEDIEENGQVFALICDILRDFYDILWTKKCEKNALSFDDSERLVIDMLIDYDENGNVIQSETAKAMSEEYDIIMIDEYQDSNNKQDMIFKLLSRNFRQDSNGKSCYGDNVFLVGDVKQSIYRFRLANPDNFIDTFKKSVPYEKDTDHKNVSVCLNKNFRSSSEVIDYSNYVFETLMSEKCGDIKYDENEKLYVGAEEYKNAQYMGKTEIALIDGLEYDDEDSDENSIPSETDFEAEYTAEKIASMINNGIMAVRKDGSLEKCQPKDFCILVRETKYAKNFVEALKKRGVYAKGEEEKGYLKSREIKILLDILRIIDNPLLDIPTTAVLMSPMFIFTAQEIAEIRAIAPKESIYITVVKISDGEYDEEFKIPDLLKVKCSGFIQNIKDFRMYSIIYTIEELIEAIYDRTDFLTIMQQFVDGEKKKANLRALIQYAKNYEANSTNGGSLSGFLRYIDRILADDADLPQGKISAVSENYVSIKTIHKSKGLEYPFIFLAKTSTLFKDDSKKTVMCGQDNVIGFKLNQPQYMRRVRTIPFEQIYNEAYKKSISEELRLLYVALTRAKQKLFINLSVNEKQITRIGKVNEILAENDYNCHSSAPYAKSMSDWIWMTLLTHKKFSEISEHYSMDIESTTKSDNDLFDISFFSRLSEDISEETVEEVCENPAIIQEIQNIMNYQYDFSRSQIPAKMSVTQFISQHSQNSDDEPTELSQPMFLLENTNKATGAERGTVIHRFFQFFDFDSSEDDLVDEIQSMIDKNYFTEDESKLIPVDKIKAFLKSNTCKRIKKALSVEREYNFMLEINDLDYQSNIQTDFLYSDGMIVGVIDLIIEEPDGLVIVDYKSDRGASERKLKEKYSEQLNLYKSALELITGKKVKEKILYSVELEKEIYL